MQNKYRLYYIVAFLCILIIALIRLFPCHPLVRIISPVNQSALEVELIGAIFGTLVLGLIVQSIGENLRQKQNETSSGRVFNTIVIPLLKHSLSRAKSDLNTNLSRNNRAYFDNTSINNLYDAIDKSINSIREFEEHKPNNKVVKKLISFKEKVDEGYILGEKFDNHLIRMAAICHVEQVRDRYLIIYLKGYRYSEFTQTDLNILLRQDNDYGNNIIDFVSTYFDNPENNTKLELKETFSNLDKKMKKMILKLKKDLKETKKLLYGNNMES